jgi:hypothetical protein
MEPLQRKLTPEELDRLAAGDVAQIAKQRSVQDVAAEAALRRWCVEQAVKVVSGVALPPSAPNSTVNISVDVASVARDIFNFVDTEVRRTDDAKKEARQGAS